MTTLSLCMIVRDEAEMLPRFLAAAKGLYDELCVVDTGSTDNTVALLQAAGARIEKLPWADDFSQARNHSLQMASCERILVLDADEMVTPAFVAECRKVAANPQIGAATVTMSNTLPHGHRKQANLLRLFRRDPAVRFRHRIHEDITDAVIDDLQASSLALGHIRSEIEHLGYQPERALARNKKERDVNLLWQCIQDDPTDLYSWHKLLEQGQFWDDIELSEQAAEGIEQLLEDAEDVPTGCAHFFGQMVVALAMLRMPYEEPAATALVDLWAQRLPENAALCFYRGQLREAAGALDLAEADYRRCMDLGSTTFDTQLTTTRPELGLARLAIARDNIDEAVSLVERALGRHPRDPEALLAFASIGRTLGGPDTATRLAQAYTEAYGDVAEMHAAWGEAALLDGQANEAEQHFARACTLDPATPAYAAQMERARGAAQAP